MSESGARRSDHELGAGAGAGAGALAAAAQRAETAVASRNELIRNAVAAGMSICEVELTTGVARWEVRRIAAMAGRNFVSSTDEVATQSRSTRP